jgi:sec-independent protein translocase protein TatA
MHTTIAGAFSGTEILVVVIVALVLFGSRKIPEFARGLGQAVKEFKKASHDDPNPPATPPTPPAPPAGK